MAQEAPPDRFSTWVRWDQGRPHCTRPWRQLTVLSDGDTICACPDMSKTNPLGNVFARSVADVWNGFEHARLREFVEKDIDRVPICRGCPMRTAVAPPAGSHADVPLPTNLVIETVGGCNLECPGCDRASIEGGRTSLVMPFDAYAGIVDQLSPHLRYMEFYVAGENWMHPRAAEMVRYCADRNPRCAIHTSTNAHYFETDKKARDCVESGIDVVVCSIDGTTQETYERGKTRGDLRRALDGMRRLLRMRDAAGTDGPLIVWRYILFRWNSRPEQLDEARRMAREIGVDHLVWHLNADKPGHNGERYYVGSPHLHEIADELWDTLPDRSERMKRLVLRKWSPDGAPIDVSDPLGIASYPAPLRAAT